MEEFHTIDMGFTFPSNREHEVMILVDRLAQTLYKEGLVKGGFGARVYDGGDFYDRMVSFEPRSD